MEFERPYFSLQGVRRDNPGTPEQGVRIPAATWQLGQARDQQDRKSW